MRGKVSRAVFTGLLAGCMAVTPVGTAYAESIPAEISVETTAEESAETEDVSESMEAEAEVETPEAEEPEVVVESEEAAAAEDAEAASVEAGYKDPVQGFVARLYENILNRKPDANGLKAWADVLKSGKEQGAKVAQGFVESKEFQSRKMDDTTYIKILYRTFLDREADANGLKAWQSVLDSGLSRMHVFRGFAESQEFTKICQSYGIQRGNAILTEPRDQNEGVTKFVVRNYRLCLERDADQGGLNAWCTALLSGSNNAKEVAHGFFFSNEFMNKNLSDRDYITLLYKVLMDRNPDASGLNAWCQVLDNGYSRENVFNQFADSNEFQTICSRYGIQSGSGIYVGQSDIDIVSYLTRYQELPGMFHMRSCGDWMFGGSGTAYETENYFNIVWLPNGNFSMLNGGAKNINLAGCSLGTDFTTFHNSLLGNGWEAGYYSEEDGDIVVGYAKVIGGAPYLVELMVNSGDTVIAWYLNNWPEGDMGEYFECLR